MNTLRELLGRLAEGGFDTVDGLAAGLGLGRRELDVMLIKLRELGYIEDVAGGLRGACSEGRSSCAGCHGCGAGLGEGGHVWRLTPKGRAAAGKNGEAAAAAEK